MAGWILINSRIFRGLFSITYHTIAVTKVCSQSVNRVRLNGTFSWVWGSTAAIKKGFCWKKQSLKWGSLIESNIYSTYGKRIWLVLQQVCCYCFCFNHYVPKVKGCLCSLLLKPVQSVVQKPAFVILTTSQLCAFIPKKDWDPQDFICLQDI